MIRLDLNPFGIEWTYSGLLCGNHAVSDGAIIVTVDYLPRDLKHTEKMAQYIADAGYVDDYPRRVNDEVLGYVQFESGRRLQVVYYCTIVARYTGCQWKSGGPDKPLFAFDGDRPVACVMPLREEKKQ